jgi:hypothetical protein
MAAPKRDDHAARRLAGEQLWKRLLAPIPEDEPERPADPEATVQEPTPVRGAR